MFKKGLMILIFMGVTIAKAHEKTPSYLQIDYDGERAKISFKQALDGRGKQTIFLEFPTHWKQISYANSVLGDLGIEDMVFEVSELAGDLGIRRNSENTSSLILTVKTTGEVSTVILDPDIELYTLTAVKEPWITTFKSFTLLGVEHILLGIDHLLFVLALLFLVQGRQLIMAITAFTLAHSITLGFSTLGIIALPSSVVEALIAFSIVLMAVAVFKPIDQRRTNNYVAMAFFFGLLHGFGFAGVLAELGLPENNLLMALFSFNLGVEIGQLFFVACMLVLIPLISRLVPKPAFVKICSYVIGSIAVFWFLDRTIGTFF